MTQTESPDQPRSTAARTDDATVIAKGGAVATTGQLVSRALLFLFVAVAVRTLGEAGFGVYRQVYQILSLATHLAPAGFNFAAVRFIARARALDQPGEVRGTARVALTVAGAFSSVSAAVLYIGAETLAGYFADDAASRQELAELLRLGAFYIPLFAVMQVLRSCTQAYKTMVPSAIIGQVIVPLGRLILGIAALLAGYAIAGAVVSLVISAGLGLVAGVWYLRRMLTDEERHARPHAPVKEMFRFAIPQAGVGLLSVQSMGLSIILLGLMASDRQVGLFSVALSLQGAGSVFLTGVVAIWAPVVVDLYERGEIARLEALYQTIDRWIVTFAFPVYAVLIIAPEIPLRLLTGGADPDAARVIAILAVGNIFFVGSGPCSYLISMTGRAGLNLIDSVIAVVLYVVLGMWLVPRYGAVGMAIGDAAVTTVINITRLVQAKVLIGVHPFGRSFWKPVRAVSVMVAALLVWRFVAPTGLLYGLAGLAAAGACYLLVLRAQGIDPEEREVYERIMKRLLRRKR